MNKKNLKKLRVGSKIKIIKPCSEHSPVGSIGYIVNNSVFHRPTIYQTCLAPFGQISTTHPTLESALPPLKSMIALKS